MLSTVLACKRTPPAPTSTPEPEPSSPTPAATEAPHTISLFAGDQPQAEHLRLDGGYVYWKCDNLETEVGSVVRAPLNGGKVETLVSQKNLTSFTTGGGSLYWFVNDDEGSGLFAKALVGGARRRLAARSGGSETIYEHAGAVYWSEQGSLFRVRTTGGAPTRLREGQGGTFDALVGHGDEVFWSSSDTLLTQHVDGSGFRELAKGFRAIRDIAVDATAVYVADTGNGTGEGPSGAVSRIERDTGRKTTLLEGIPRPWSVFVQGDQVFVVGNGSRGLVARISPQGGKRYDFASNVKSGTSIVVDDKSIFWTSGDPGTVWRATR
jgi:hypothetical protein